MAFRNAKGISVSPSPLNPVKLELAILMIVGMLLWVAHERITADPIYQLILLGGYGLAAMAWLVVRTRRIVTRRAAAAMPARDPAAGPRRGGASHDPE